MFKMMAIKAILFSFLALLVMGCSATQKTAGQGMVSVVAQNAVRIAGAEAISKLDLDEVRGKACTVEVTGFADDFTRGYVVNIVRDAVEDLGGRLAKPEEAEMVIEVAVNAAGNDLGANSYFVGSSVRSEGSLNLTITARDSATGARISRQQIEGYAKYQQGSFLGITGSGAYFVLKDEDWEIVDDPAFY
jgi:hypothetical protein